MGRSRKYYAENASVVFGVRASTVEVARIDLAAKERGVTRNRLILDAIDAYIKEKRNGK